MSVPKLPPELECEIFEMAARSCREDLEPGLNLQLVARRVHVWAERVFLEVIALRNTAHAEQFLHFVNSKPTGFFADIVRALLLPYAISAENTSKVLSVCTGVRIFVCWVDCRGTPPELPLQISHLPLVRLDIEIRHLLSLPLATSAWLSTLTHLDLTFWDEFDHSIGLLELCRQLPQLTHIHLDHLNAPEWRLDFARELCSSCPSLRVVYLAGEEGVDGDPRIVYQCRYSAARDSVQEWVRSLASARPPLSRSLKNLPLLLSMAAGEERRKA
ncbi:hypothetical protein C8J57DRAFT_338165 [Mycena rebaudengoi]|nr:hypothetical protein C8J57DRAFT_338165 [Mycena rebaudengoi]